MPEQIRLKVGGVTAQQINVYDEFSRCIPGFIPVGGTGAGGGGGGVSLSGPSSTPSLGVSTGPSVSSSAGGPPGGSGGGISDQSGAPGGPPDMNAQGGPTAANHPPMPFIPKQPHLVLYFNIR